MEKLTASNNESLHNEYQHTLFYSISLPISLLPLFHFYYSSNSSSFADDNLHLIASNLKITFGISIPLIIEYYLDSFMRWLDADSAAHKVEEHRFGHGLIILTSFFTSFILLFNSQYFSVESYHRIISIGLSIAVCGVMGKLQVFMKQYWKLENSLVIVVLFAVSQTLISASESPLMSIIPSILFSLLCLVKYSEGCLLLMKQKFCTWENLKDVLQSNDYAAFMLSFGLVGLLLSQVIFRVIVLCNLHIVSSFQVTTVGIDIVTSTIFMIMVAVLPGRVIRRSLLLLKREMALKKCFVRYISHEIRSPLSTATLGLDYIIENVTKNQSTMNMEELIDLLADIKQSCDIATETMNEFLLLDKIESNMLSLAMNPTNLWSLVYRSTSLFKLQMRAGGIDFRCNIDTPSSTEVLAMVDEPKLTQVLRNFLTNALKFTPAGGKIHVDMSVQDCFTADVAIPCANKVVRVQVRDFGHGLTKENVSLLFGQYVQFDANKLQGGNGSGLGLWISKSIVQFHGGKIGADSAGIGHGCVFYFELPIIKGVQSKLVCADMYQSGQNRSRDESDMVESDEILIKNSSFNIAGNELTSNERTRSIDTLVLSQSTDSSDHVKLNVMLIDDSSLSRKMVDKALASTCSCSHASGGLEAIELFRQNVANNSKKYDIMMVDFYMPDMTGAETIKVIRSMGYKGLVIGVTGTVNPADTDLLIANGANFILSKPLNLSLLNHTITSICS
eukprot:gene11756-15730_t